MNTYVLDMYRQMFASLRRGNIKGVCSNAKPVFLLSIMDYITHLGNPNHFIWGNKNFENIYISTFKIRLLYSNAILEIVLLYVF